MDDHAIQVIGDLHTWIFVSGYRETIDDLWLHAPISGSVQFQAEFIGLTNSTLNTFSRLFPLYISFMRGAV